MKIIQGHDLSLIIRDVFDQVIAFFISVFPNC